MRILLNGSPFEAPPGASVAHLIEELRLGGRRLAVELNGEIVARSTYSATTLREDDHVEIVQAIGGG